LMEDNLQKYKRRTELVAIVRARVPFGLSKTTDEQCFFVCWFNRNNGCSKPARFYAHTFAQLFYVVGCWFCTTGAIHNNKSVSLRSGSNPTALEQQRESEKGYTHHEKKQKVDCCVRGWRARIRSLRELESAPFNVLLSLRRGTFVFPDRKRSFYSRDLCKGLRQPSRIFAGIIQ